MLKKINRKSPTLVRLFFNLFLFTYISIQMTFPNLGDTKLALLNIPFDSEINLIRDTYGMSDAGSYLDVAISLANFQNIQPDQYFFIHTWSPGQPIVLALAILLSKFTLPVYIVVFLINYSIWFFIITFLTKKLSSRIQIVFFYTFFLTFLFSIDFEYYFYTHMFHSEGISNSLLFIALLFLSWLIKNKVLDWIKYVYVGLVLGFSILVRYTIETGLLLLLLILTIWLILQLLETARFKYRIRFKEIGYKKILRLTFLSVLVALLTTIPWRIMNLTLYEMDTVRLSNASSWTIYGVWELEDGYWSGNGSNWACKIDPVKCKYLNSTGLKTLSPEAIGKEALKSVIKNPSSYIVERFKYMKLHYFGGSPLKIDQYQIYFSILALLSGAYLFILLFNKKYWNYENFIIIIIWACFVVNQFLMYSITHFEYRYFIILKFLVFGCIFSLHLQVKNNP